MKKLLTFEIANPQKFNADLDPVFHLNAGPDTTSHFNVDPDPATHQSDEDLSPQVYRPSRTLF